MNEATFVIFDLKQQKIHKSPLLRLEDHQTQTDEFYGRWRGIMND